MSSTYTRAFAETLHPRAPVGAAAGGQFVSADAGKGEAGGKDASDEKQTEVKAVQKLLGLEETGEFSAADAEAVKKYQKEHGLQVDGKVGAQTIASLLGDGKRGPGALTASDHQKLQEIAGKKAPAKLAPTKKPTAAKSSPAKAGTSAKGATKPPAKATAAKPPAKAPAAAKPPASGKGQAADKDRAAVHDGNPHLSEDGKRYWEHGEGAAKIRWGTGGATRRCHRLLMQHAHFSDQDAWGYCAERHHAVTGRWPGEKAGKGRRDELVPAQTRGAVEIGVNVEVPAERAALAGQPETREVPFDLESSSDGLNFSGYAAVFDSPTTIRDSLGEFREHIARGAFRSSLAAKTPVLMFNHGKHPVIGDMPLGRITRASEDDHGLYVEARLTDNWLIQPVRDAISDGAVSGMSFRMIVPVGGDVWSKDGTAREIRSIDCSELGPVVFPAYTPTTASVRSALDHLPDLSGASVARSAERGRPVAEVDDADLARTRRARALLLRGIR